MLSSTYINHYNAWFGIIKKNGSIYSRRYIKWLSTRDDGERSIYVNNIRSKTSLETVLHRCKQISVYGAKTISY